MVGNSDLRKIIELREEGKHAEALKAHIWFHEESRKSAGMGGVRLSYAIADWVKLSESFTPARTELLNLRNRYESKLTEGKGGFDEFHDLSAINQYIGQEGHTYQVFKELHERNPDIAESCYHVAEKLLIQNKEYEICSKYMKDPSAAFENIRHMRELNIGIAKENVKLNDEEFISHIDKSFIEDTLNLITLLVSLKEIGKAKEIKEKAISYFPHEKIQNASVSLP